MRSVGLWQVPLFEGLTPHKLAVVASAARPLYSRRPDPLFRFGQLVETGQRIHSHLIQAGSTRMTGVSRERISRLIVKGLLLTRSSGALEVAARVDGP